MPKYFIDHRGQYYETITDVETPNNHTAVPQRPGPWYSWQGEKWIEGVNPNPSEEDIKMEAYRRIIAICPEWKQRNLTAQAAILAEKGRDNWTAEELTAWEAGEAIWSEIAAIRAKSDEIELMDPIPQDYTEDKWWT